MGVCVTKPGEVAERAVRGDGEESGCGAQQKRRWEDFIHPAISEVPPEYFYPDTPLSVLEENCRKTVENITLKAAGATFKHATEDMEEKGTLSIIRSKVLSISAQHSTSISNLAYSLTCDSSKYLQKSSGPFSNTVAKAYAIYVWVTSNIQGKEHDWSHLLKNWKGSSSDYASLFNMLCREAGLNAEKIEGHLRGWRSRTRHIFCPNEQNQHCWNVVSAIAFNRQN